MVDLPRPDDNPKSAAGAAKPHLGLCPKVALEALARAMESGAAKYGPWNWRATPIAASVYTNAIARHWAAWKEGLDVDEESGVSPLAHIMASCAIVLDAQANGMLIDDRPGRHVEGFLQAKPTAEYVEALPSPPPPPKGVDIPCGDCPSPKTCRALDRCALYVVESR